MTDRARRVRRWSIACAALVAVGCVASVGFDLAWHAGEPSARPPFTPPRTPWGDPDLQGSFSNVDELGIPMERPLADSWLEKISKVVIPGAAPPTTKSRRNKWEDIYEGPPNHSRRWLVVDPPDGRMPSLTREASLRRAGGLSTARDVAPWIPLGPSARCLSRGMPDAMMPALFGNVFDITQGPGMVAIRSEMMNEARVIPLGTSTHVGPAIRFYMGDPRGRYDGDSLVVETTNFNGKAPFRGATDQLRLVERFTPMAPDILEWAVTVDDPATWSRPWTFAMQLSRVTRGPLEFACHEGNYALRNMLTAE